MAIPGAAGSPRRARRRRPVGVPGSHEWRTGRVPAAATQHRGVPPPRRSAAIAELGLEDVVEAGVHCSRQRAQVSRPYASRQGACLDPARSSGILKMLVKRA
jgi:hypothetical protein